MVQRGVALFVREVIIDAITQIEPPQYRRFFQMHFFFGSAAPRVRAPRGSGRDEAWPGMTARARRAPPRSN